MRGCWCPASLADCVKGPTLVVSKGTAPDRLCTRRCLRGPGVGRLSGRPAGVPGARRSRTMLAIHEYEVGKWQVPAVTFVAEDRSLVFPVMGLIGNSVATSESGKRRTAEWKREVASAAKEARGGPPLDPRWAFSVTVGLSFHPASHGNQGLDVENFLKPTFDALAAGLFCSAAQDARSIDRYRFDDSNFRYLFIHRLPDAEHQSDEGAGFVISVRSRLPGLGG